MVAVNEAPYTTGAALFALLQRTRTALEVPSVLHSAWQLPDGRTGCVFACVAFQAVPFEALGHSLSLQPGEAAFRILE